MLHGPKPTRAMVVLGVMLMAGCRPGRTRSPPSEAPAVDREREPTADGILVLTSVDGAHRPLGPTELLVAGQDPHTPEGRFYTNAAGMIAIELPAGRYRAAAFAPDGYVEFRDFTVTAATEVQIELVFEHSSACSTRCSQVAPDLGLTHNDEQTGAATAELE